MNKLQAEGVTFREGLLTFAFFLGLIVTIIGAIWTFVAYLVYALGNNVDVFNMTPVFLLSGGIIFTIIMIGFIKSDKM
jgi:hypothetical protein